MAQKKISELTAAGALTGAELVPIVQSGATVRTTTQDIADLGGGGPGASEFNIATVDTLADPIILDLDETKYSVLSSTDTLTEDITATLTNETDAAVLDWAFEVSGADGSWGVTIAGIVTDDVRYAGGKFIPEFDGLYRVHVVIFAEFQVATFYGPLT